MSALQAYRQLQRDFLRCPWGKIFLQGAWGVLDRIPKLVDLLIEERAARRYAEDIAGASCWDLWGGEKDREAYLADARKELGL